jgi:hypothetical protein
MGTVVNDGTLNVNNAGDSAFGLLNEKGGAVHNYATITIGSDSFTSCGIQSHGAVYNHGVMTIGSNSFCNDGTFVTYGTITFKENGKEPRRI